MIGTHYTYWLVFALMMVGLYTVISHGNLVKKMIGLGLFQAAVFILYISLGKVTGGRAPVLEDGTGTETYSNPLPQVLILTAIVVGVATTALGLALAVRIFDAYGTLEEDEMLRRDAADGPDS